MKETYKLNNKLRLKVTDRCNMHCSFCHSEGSQGAKDLVLDERACHILERLRDGFDAVHITGGEPTLYPSLEELIKKLHDLGYKVSLTINGYFPLEKVTRQIESVESINFSLHSLNEVFLEKFVKDPQEYKENVRKNILYLKDKTRVAVNTVATSDPQQNIREIVEFCFGNKIPINILQELNKNILPSIKKGFLDHGFTVTEKIYIYPGSNVRTVFQDKKGNQVLFKEIEHFALESWCGGCPLLNQCDEGFSFIRLEDNPLRVRMCINREPISFDTFMKEYYEKIKALLQR